MRGGCPERLGSDSTRPNRRRHRPLRPSDFSQSPCVVLPGSRLARPDCGEPPGSGRAIFTVLPATQRRAAHPPQLAVDLLETTLFRLKWTVKGLDRRRRCAHRASRDARLSTGYRRALDGPSQSEFSRSRDRRRIAAAPMPSALTAVMAGRRPGHPRDEAAAAPQEDAERCAAFRFAVRQLNGVDGRDDARP